MRKIKSLPVGLILLFLAFTACSTSMTVSENRMRVLMRRAVSQGGGYPDLNEHVFGPKVIFTGVMKGDVFANVIGYWMFLTKPHRPNTTPVVLVHGHSTGPRLLKTLADSLDPDRFEPWFCFYPTGLKIKSISAMFRQSLDKMAKRYNKKKIYLIAYSMGGLVARQALRPYDDGISLPKTPLFIGISNPWNGSEETKFESERSFAPGSWEDVADGSEFLARLYDDPLPGEVDFHYIYGLGGKPDNRIGEQNDGILSKASLARKEALGEAKSVTLYADADHKSILSDKRTIQTVNNLLLEYDSKSPRSD